MSRKLAVFGSALVAALLGLGTNVKHAHAHASPHGLQLVWTSDDPNALPYIVSNRGLIAPNVSSQDGAGSLYSLRCNEAYGVNTSAFPVVLVDENDSLVMQTTDSVSVSNDRGCSWTPATSLPDISLGGFVQNPSAPNKLIVTTQIYTPTVAQVFGSEDYGRTWNLLATNQMYSIYTQLLQSTDGAQLFAAGQHYDLDKKDLQNIWAASTDGGKTWVDTTVDLARFPLGFHPTNNNIVFARAPDPDLTIDPVDHLLRSTDGGKTFTEVAQIPPITSFAATPDGSVLWIGSLTGGLYKSTDGGLTFAQEDPTEVAGITCLSYRQDRLWVCANFAPNTNGVWWSADKGQSYTRLLDFTSVKTEVTCGADQTPICMQPWIDWQYELLYNFTVDAGVPGDPDGGPISDASAPITDAGDAEAEPTPEDAGIPHDAAVTTPVIKHKDSGGCSTASGRALSAQWTSLLLVGLALMRARRKRA